MAVLIDNEDKNVNQVMKLDFSKGVLASLMFAIADIITASSNMAR